MSDSSNRVPILVMGSVVIAVVAAAAGAVVGLSLAAGRAPAERASVPEPPPLPAAVDAPPEDERVRRHVGSEPESPAAGETVPADGIAMSKEAFLKTYRAAFEDAAGRLPSPQREDAAWGRAHDAIFGVPASFGRQDGAIDANNRREIEVGERDDIMAFLTDRDRRRDLLALRNDPGTLSKLFAHQAAGPRLDGPTRLAASEGLVDDGTTLVFGPGVHAPSWRAIGENGNQMPRDLTIQGAGMDATLIRLSDFSPRDVVWNLHIRDCTIDCGNDGAFDLRIREASVFAERVRFVRFDAGHGGCDLFTAGGEGGAVYARSCVFAGGYGRSPGCGNIVDDIEMARFEDCTFERITYKVLGRHNDVDGAAFVRCVFRDCPADIAALDGDGRDVPASVVVEDCRTEWTIPEDRRGRPSGDVLGRSLRVLFPGASER